MLRKLEDRIKACTKCRLHEERNKAVPGSGDPESGVVLIGEGPGRWEDSQGLPFVGRAGKLLDEVLEDNGLNREQIYITNIVKCRPPKNRKPKTDEVETCTRAYLNKQLETISPTIIGTLGATAGEYIFDKYGFKWSRMFKENGKVREKNTILGRISIVPIVHPAAVLRNPNWRVYLETAIEKIAQLI